MSLIAATARQVEYQLRIVYALADPPIQLKDGPLIDHMLWETLLRSKFPKY
jgi:hypothetical protein